MPSIEENLFEATNMTSGSGSGQRLLEQRTIARQIKKIEIVGMYGIVLLFIAVYCNSVFVTA